MLIRQKGIIIGAVNYGESDKIITILNEYGAKVPLMARRARKVKTGLQTQTQLFVYGLFIYNQWRGMGALNSVDIISRYYRLQMDLYVSSYAALATEAIERSVDEGDIAPCNHQLLQFVLEKVESSTSAQLMSVVAMLKRIKRFDFTASFNHCAMSGNDAQADLMGYSFRLDGVISRQEASKDVHAVVLSNKTPYLLDVLQKLPIDKMSSLNIHQEIIDGMSDIILMLYRGYAGVFFKSQKLINQSERLEQ